MTRIQRSALVQYSPRQMFELVDDIHEYPRFLPWCHKSAILSQSENSVEASLDIAFAGLHKSFTTRNTLHPYDRMEICLVNGPFRNLTGLWQFLETTEGGCVVKLELEFALASLLDHLFQPVFCHIGNSLVDAFCQRAVEVYGND